jgi:hypothetical protein
MMSIVGPGLGDHDKKTTGSIVGRNVPVVIGVQVKGWPQ